jgi:hypothetical protein
MTAALQHNSLEWVQSIESIGLLGGSGMKKS